MKRCPVCSWIPSSIFRLWSYPIRIFLKRSPGPRTWSGRWAYVATTDYLLSNICVSLVEIRESWRLLGAGTILDISPRPASEYIYSRHLLLLLLWLPSWHNLLSCIFGLEPPNASGFFPLCIQISTFSPLWIPWLPQIRYSRSRLTIRLILLVLIQQEAWPQPHTASSRPRLGAWRRLPFSGCGCWRLGCSRELWSGTSYQPINRRLSGVDVADIGLRSDGIQVGVTVDIVYRPIPDVDSGMIWLGLVKSRLVAGIQGVCLPWWSLFIAKNYSVRSISKCASSLLPLGRRIEATFAHAPLSSFCVWIIIIFVSDYCPFLLPWGLCSRWQFDRRRLICMGSTVDLLFCFWDRLWLF